MRRSCLKVILYFKQLRQPPPGRGEPVAPAGVVLTRFLVKKVEFLMWALPTPTRERAPLTPFITRR